MATSTRKAIEDKLEAELEAWEKEVEETKAKAAAQKAEARVAEADAKTQEQLQSKIRGLKTSVDEAREKLEKLKKSSDDAWDDLKGGIEKTWHQIGKTVDSVVSHF